MKTFIVWALSAALFSGASSTAGDMTTLQSLSLEILRGDRSVNSLTSKANVVAPVVRVRTASGAPAPGIRVRFELSDRGERGVFADGQTAMETETNARGEATAAGYVAARKGAFTIQVTALHDNQKITASIHQRNGSQPLFHRPRNAGSPNLSGCLPRVGVGMERPLSVWP